MREIRPLSAVDFLQFDSAGVPYLRGSRCGKCNAVAPGDRSVCNACGARDAIAPIRLSEQGTLYTYTIVHRSFPGVETPFLAAIVDLEGGGALKGTLLNTAIDPRQVAYGMPVRVIYRDTGQCSAEGRPFFSYYFVPIEGAA
jgi:uncharacterized OB-fold protein